MGTSKEFTNGSGLGIQKDQLFLREGWSQPQEASKDIEEDEALETVTEDDMKDWEDYWALQDAMTDGSLP